MWEREERKVGRKKVKKEGKERERRNEDEAWRDEEKRGRQNDRAKE